MKKIFTLIAVAAMALTANAQQIFFGEGDVAATGTQNGKVYSNGSFSLTVVDQAAKMAVDANNAYFGDANASEKFTHRLKTGGKSQVKDNATSSLTLAIPSAGTLKVYVRTGSNAATDRTVVLTQSGTSLFSQVIQETDAVTVQMESSKSETNPDGDTKVYPVISVSVAAGSVDVAYPVGSMNFYGFEFVAGEGGGDSGQGGDDSGQGGGQGASVIDFPTSQVGITISGTTEWNNSQKYHNNTDATSNISFANGYTSEGVINDNYAALAVEGGFKAGDVVSVAGYFNNNDDAKQAAVTIFTGDKGEAPTDLWTSSLFINGRKVAADPTVESYTLTADYNELKLGRANGLTSATRTNVTLLKVTRGAAGINEVLNLKVNEKAPMYNLAGQKVGADFKGIAIQNGKKIVVK